MFGRSAGQELLAVKVGAAIPGLWYTSKRFPGSYATKPNSIRKLIFKWRQFDTCHRTNSKCLNRVGFVSFPVPSLKMTAKWTLPQIWVKPKEEDPVYRN
jgi:hypothetical protein